DDCAYEQITSEMKSTRACDIDDRKEFYLSNRIDEQRKWYAKKSKHNKTRSLQFFILLVLFQSIAVFLVLLRIALPEWKVWPTEVFVVAAGTITT
ncbi:SLATT domain-containing protein, partial [Bacillus sp. SIMBA_154]|uniref:SLATT domain-containing protein n=1 Tax=Bacillus sp. SIMBA_154 TaxID=3080859 RepID=UPI003977FD90